MALLPSNVGSLRDRPMNSMKVLEKGPLNQLGAAPSRSQEGRWCKLSCSVNAQTCCST